MLKRINVSDVELGMFVHKLEGSWFRHPFWKSKFLLQDPAMLADLQASDVPAVVIDVAKGVDLRPQPVRIAPPPTETQARPRPRAVPSVTRSQAASRQRQAPAAVDLRSTAPQSLAREFGAASRVAGASRKVVSRTFLESRFGKTIKAGMVEPVIEDIFASVQRNPHAFNGLMRCKRDNEFIYRHALAVSALMISLARQMRFAPDEIREAGMTGLLMDVGIGHLPVDLGALGGDFRRIDPAILEGHVMLGHDFLQAGGNIPERVLLACRDHHELLDGSGYPQGLSGSAIGTLARMAAICDTYDILVSDTADSPGMDPASAIADMAGLSGCFDDEILRHFIQAIGVYPVGSVVRLGSGRLAMVIAQSADDHARPRVRAFWSTTQEKAIRPADIDLSRCSGEDAIEASADPAAHGIADFPRLRERLFADAARTAG